MNFNITQKISGERIGNKLNLNLSSFAREKFNYEINFRLKQSHPGLIYDIYDSDYTEINFNTNNKIAETKSINLKLKKQNLGSLDITFSNIINQFYLTTNNEQQSKLIPIVNQFSDDITYLKLKYNKELKFGSFSLDNSILFQNVTQSQKVLNLPKFLIRNTLYLSEKIFNNILDIQTGLSLKIFSKFYADEYNPLLSTFNVQTSKKIGGFPILDFFVNAKIRQTRIFLIAEHFNSSFSSGKFFSSPTIPYRDSNIRFGFSWNLFN